MSSSQVALSCRAAAGNSFRSIAMDFSFDNEGGMDMPAEDSEAQAQAQETGPDVCALGLCSCCERSPRVPKCKFGRECKKALNNITSDEAKKFKADPKNPDRIKEHEQLQKLKKEGGEALNRVIMSYRAQMESSKKSGSKRRGTFELSHELEQLRVEQSVGEGVQLLYMTHRRWLEVAAKKHGKNTSEAQADWDKTLRNLPLHKQRGKGAQLKLPMPDEEYIRGENTTTHGKTFEMASKNSKITDKGLDMAQISADLHKGGFDLQDSLFKGAGAALSSSASLAGMDLTSPSKTESASMASLQQSIGGSGSSTGQAKAKAKPDSKKKRYDLLAAKNRCRAKLLDDLKKTREGFKQLVKEADDLILTHANSSEYDCYVSTLKQRLQLVRSALTSFVPADVESARSIQTAVTSAMGDGFELRQVVTQKFHALIELKNVSCSFDPALTDVAAKAQQSALGKVVANVGKVFEKRNADGMAYDDHVGLLPLPEELLKAAESSGEANATADEIASVKSGITDFLVAILGDACLRRAVAGLETTPLDDISKLQVVSAMEKTLLSMLDSAADEASP